MQSSSAMSSYQLIPCIPPLPTWNREEAKDCWALHGQRWRLCIPLLSPRHAYETESVIQGWTCRDFQKRPRRSWHHRSWLKLCRKLSIDRQLKPEEKTVENWEDSRREWREEEKSDDRRGEIGIVFLVYLEIHYIYIYKRMDPKNGYNRFLSLHAIGLRG